ncbi:hypothetical protein [Bradyrhizobium sp. BR 1433]|uniref:hypothetical protein n=1 Tax=Bradyrhizobium sp. BR 1433 TaxID=3447967 RepID=UPI003EE4638A
MVLREPSGQVGHNGSGISGAADHQRHHDDDQHAAAHRYADDDAGIIRGRHLCQSLRECRFSPQETYAYAKEFGSRSPFCRPQLEVLGADWSDYPDHPAQITASQAVALIGMRFTISLKGLPSRRALHVDGRCR